MVSAMIDVFDPTKLKRGAKVTGAIAAVALLLVLSRVHVLVGGLALIVFAVTAFQCLIYSSTLTVLNLQATRKTHFQIVIATGFPVLLTGYFYYQANTVDLSLIASKFASPWMFLPIIILFVIGWSSEEALDTKLPFSGYLIAAAAMFALCFMWAQGMVSDPDDYGEGSYFLIDREEAEAARASGVYVVQYPLYVAILYAGLLSKQVWEDRKSQHR
jgi:hypothetical protein